MPAKIIRQVPKPVRPPVTSVELLSDMTPGNRLGVEVRPYVGIGTGQFVVEWTKPTERLGHRNAVVDAQSVREFAAALLEMVGD